MGAMALRDDVFRTGAGAYAGKHALCALWTSRSLVPALALPSSRSLFRRLRARDLGSWKVRLSMRKVLTQRRCFLGLADAPDV